VALEAEALLADGGALPAASRPAGCRCVRRREGKGAQRGMLALLTLSPIVRRLQEPELVDMLGAPRAHPQSEHRRPPLLHDLALQSTVQVQVRSMMEEEGGHVWWWWWDGSGECRCARW